MAAIDNPYVVSQFFSIIQSQLLADFTRYIQSGGTNADTLLLRRFLSFEVTDRFFASLNFESPEFQRYRKR